MLGCPTCTMTFTPVNSALKLAIRKATEHARENKETTAVYSEDGQYKFAEAFQALSQGLNVVNIVSAHS